MVRLRSPLTPLVLRKIPYFRADHLYVFTARQALKSITRGWLLQTIEGIYRIFGMHKERSPHLVSAIEQNLNLIKGSIGFDIDGVVQASFVLALKKASNRVKEVILKEHITSYWELSNIGKRHKMTDPEALEFAMTSYNDHDVYLNAPLMDGIKPLLEILYELKKPIIFGSARPPEFAETTKKMFARELPWIDPDTIFLGRKKEMGGGEYKSSLIKTHNVGLYIEDSITEAREMATLTNVLVFLVPQEWNRNEIIEDPSRIQRLGKYEENAESWPILKYLVRPEAKAFLSRSVAQC